MRILNQTELDAVSAGNMGLHLPIREAFVAFAAIVGVCAFGLGAAAVYGYQYIKK